MTAPVQTDLLLELWHQTVQPAVWTAPHDTAAGMKAGDTCMGWRCPVCGRVEWNASTLDLNHGWDPNRPGRKPFDGGCHRLRLLAAHDYDSTDDMAAYQARLAELESADLTSTALEASA